VATYLKTFIAIRGNLIQRESEIINEILRQPMFGNPMILEVADTPLGKGPNMRLHLWARSGICTIKNLWDEAEGDWKTAKAIQ